MSVYVCRNCDAQSPKWAGRCLECGKWGTLDAHAEEKKPAALKKRSAAIAEAQGATPVALADVRMTDVPRKSTGLAEVDRVLGGGIVPGSLLLLGGDPGIGKSTLVGQIAGSLAGDVLYVSGEESGQQVKMRMDRLRIRQERVQFLAETHVEVICKTIVEKRPAFVIIDSIQTMASSAEESEPGSVNQIKAATVRFLETAKRSTTSILLIGHVTKGGELGGPKLLEHLVDAVFYLEGDRQHQFRLLRGVKNRFGPTDEVGIFEMREIGLVAVDDPSAVILAERSQASGSCMTVAVEGTRMMLLEIQALVAKAPFGYPQRKVTGYDLNRLNILLAILDRRVGIAFEQQDVFVNIAGGIRSSEPALDLAVCLALVSARTNVALAPTMVAFGEVGLGGEVRSIPRLNERKKEAERFRLTQIIAPRSTKKLVDALHAAGLETKNYSQ